MLKQLDEYKDAEVIRTRDPEVIAKGDVVVDVGAVYDPARNLFDHHQREFTETFSPKHTVTKLSSAGLVYKHFGKSVICKVLGWEESDHRLDIVYNKVYTDLVEGFDAIDNGVSQYPASLAPAYINKTGISARVARLQPAWNETEHLPIDELFENAIRITGEEFIAAVTYVGKSWLPARDIVLNAVKSRFDVDPSGRIICLETFCPWKEHLYLIEQELGLAENELPLYMLYPDTAAQWRIQAVPISPDSFSSRKALPEQWRVSFFLFIHVFHRCYLILIAIRVFAMMISRPCAAFLDARSCMPLASLAATRTR